MTESEVRKLLRQMKELDSQTAFRDFYNMTYDRLFRIAYYYVKQEEWSQEIVLDVFLKLWKQLSGKRIKTHLHSSRFSAGATGTELFTGRITH